MKLEVTIKARVFDNDSIFMATQAGTYDHPSGVKCDLLINMNGIPLVKLPDGRTVSFSWYDLADAALQVEKIA